MKGLMAGAVLLTIAAALVGCSAADNKSSTPPQASVAGSTNPGVAAPSAAAPSIAEASVAPPSSPAAGGTATEFCGAFKVLQAINDDDAPTGDLKSVGAQMQAAAADMRKYAPAEIAKGANTYADLMDSIGKAVAGGSVDQAALSKAISDGTAGNMQDFTATVVWVAKNCNL